MPQDKGSKRIKRDPNKPKRKYTRKAKTETQPVEEPTVEAVETPPVEEPKKKSSQVQEWISPVSCPCGSRKVATLHSYFAGKLRIRRHQCRECKTYFTSRERL